MKTTSKLIWQRIQTAAPIEEYELWNGLQKLVTLSIDTLENKIRVACDDCRRDFHVEKEGLLLNKTILKNEYGIKIGEIGHELFFNNEGFIELNEERFHFCIQNNPLAELIIYRKSKKNPLLICALSSNDGNPSIQFSRNEESNGKTYPCLLMALCWFLFMPIAKENVSEYASA